MKANELRIGNYVEHDTLGIYKLPTVITQVVESRCKPIQLTNENLPELGFEYDRDKNHMFDMGENSGLHVCLDEGKGFYNEGKCLLIIHGAPYYSFECRHVHVLQNIVFMFTGKELIWKT